MRLEMLTLIASIVLGIIYLLAASQTSTMQRGLSWNFSSREGKTVELTGLAGRLDRAFKNFLESYIFFVAAVLIVHLTDRYSNLTLIGSQLYFWGRVAYLPIYGVGIPYLRTAVWAVSFVGIFLIVAALL